jgi:DNA repair protein RadA
VIGLSKKAAQTILDAARERVSAFSRFKLGDELVQEDKTRARLTTGTQGLDSILGGKGFQCGTLYELYGFEGAGKDILLHQLVCTAYLPPERGGLTGGSIYIDTEGSFSTKRIELIAKRFDIDPEALEAKIIHVTPPDSDTLLEFCEKQMELMAYREGARFLCLDNLATHLQAEYGGATKTLPERQNKAKRIGGAFLRAIRNSKRVAIYTNQMKREWGKQTYTYALGLAVGSIPNVRIRLDTKDRRRGLREFKIETAIDLPPNTAILKLKEDGFFDLKKKATSQENP